MCINFTVYFEFGVCIPHDQCISSKSTFFSAFELQCLANTNTLELCLNIDPKEAISAVGTTFSFSADAYDPETPFAPVATAAQPNTRSLYGNKAPAREGWADQLSTFHGTVSPWSHRTKFPSMVVHTIINKH